MNNHLNYNWDIIRVFKPSEHYIIILRLLQYTQIDCVGVDKRVSMRTPLRRRISDRTILKHII